MISPFLHTIIQCRSNGFKQTVVSQHIELLVTNSMRSLGDVTYSYFLAIVIL